MELDYRRLQPVQLDMIGQETGRQRYLKDGWSSAPGTAGWRNNLTACSSRHDFYFVAHRETVAVFQPSFPLHTLGHRPQLNIMVSLANPNAKGFLDPAHPHAINHLIVGDLGSEEILLLCTDSGNVAAYYTATIRDGIEKEPYKFNNEGRSDLAAVRPFFTHWVHESAWGLSIHKHARMLAISSNSPHHAPSVGLNAAVTVFAFALTTADEISIPASTDNVTDSKEGGPDWECWHPNVANKTELPDRSLNWKIRLEAHRYNIPSVAFVNSDEDRDGIYLLSTDIKGIIKCWNIWQGAATSTWDFSLSLRRSSDHSHYSQQTLRGWTVLPLDPRSFQVVNTFEEFSGDPNPHKISPGCLDITNSVCRVPGHDRSRAAADSVRHSAGRESTDDRASFDHYVVDGLVAPGGYGSSETHEVQVGSDGAKKIKLRHAGLPPTIQHQLPKPMSTIIPTLHLSASHLRLFDANSPHEASIYCSDLLNLQSPMYYPAPPALDRLNMTQYISELGIIVIATQIGRVAICSLTRKGVQGPYGLRVDWILPFAAQEKNGERPRAHLLGIAAGPVPGQQPSRSSSASECDSETEATWLRDRVDPDGVSLTFDPLVLQLGRTTTKGPNHDPGSPPTPLHRPSSVRSRDKISSSSPRTQQPPRPPPPSPFQLVRHPWPSHTGGGDGTAMPDEPWRGLAYSRRYRLMLTYADHSVLTYELAREAPYVGDPGVGKPNWRNRERV